MRDPIAPLQMLSGDQLQDLYETSIRILKELGIKVMGANVRDLVAKAGARIEGDMLRIDEDHVAATLATVPARITLTPARG